MSIVERARFEREFSLDGHKFRVIVFDWCDKYDNCDYSTVSVERFNKRRAWTPALLNAYWWHPSELMTITAVFTDIHNEWQAWRDAHPQPTPQPGDAATTGGGL